MLSAPFPYRLMVNGVQVDVSMNGVSHFSSKEKKKSHFIFERRILNSVHLKNLKCIGLLSRHVLFLVW